MQLADAVLRPPRERKDRLVRPRVHGQIARVVGRRRRQRDADQQIKGRVRAGPEAVDVPPFPVEGRPPAGRTSQH